MKGKSSYSGLIGTLYGKPPITPKMLGTRHVVILSMCSISTLCRMRVVLCAAFGQLRVEVAVVAATEVAEVGEG